MRGFKTYFTFLSRNKLFTIINVMGLTVSFVFILLIADMVIRQLTIDSGVKDADRIYVFATNDGVNGHYQLGLKYQDRYPEIEDWCAYSDCAAMSCKLQDNKDVMLTVSFVKKNFFDFFSYELIEGNPKEALVSDDNIVLTRSAALRLFGTEHAVGKSVNLSFGAVTVTGIIEDIDNSIFPDVIEAFSPIENAKYNNWSADINDTRLSNAGSAVVFFKFIEGFDPMTKIDDMTNYAKEFWWIFMYKKGLKAELIPMHDFYFSEVGLYNYLNRYDFSKVMMFLIAGIIILLMAVSNYVSMSVAQTSYRAKEMATRRLLGALRGSIFWRMIAEAFVMVVVALFVGLLLAKAAEPYAMDMLGVKLDVLGDFTWISASCWALFVLLLSFMSGFLPASILSGYNPLDVVKGTFRRKTKMVYLRVLNVVQGGLTIALLSCSIYFGVQIYSILNAPLGYEYGNVLEYPGGPVAQTKSFREEVMKLPFVKNVSLTCGTPNNGGNNNTFNVVSGDSSVVFSFQVFVCDSAFLDIFKIHITENRKLADHSNAFFMGEKGYNQYKQLGFGTDRFTADGRHRNFDIAGQFEDFKIRSMLLSEEHPLLIQLLPSDSIGFPWQILVEVSDGDLGSYKQQIDDMFSSLTETPYFESKWYGDMIEDTYRDVINMNDIVVIFTCVALLISLLGLMAMNIYMVSQRKRDIAVRKVFGSTAIGEQKRLMRFSLQSIAISLIIAIPLSIMGMDAIYDLVPYGDLSRWWIPVAAFVIVSVVSLISVFFISRKATRENPIENIKTE